MNDYQVIDWVNMNEWLSSNWLNKQKWKEIYKGIWIIEYEYLWIWIIHGQLTSELLMHKLEK